MGFGLFLASLLFGGARAINNHVEQEKRQKEYKDTWGNGTVSYVDEVNLCNKYYDELLKYFEERFNYYLNQPEFIINKFQLLQRLSEDNPYDNYERCFLYKSEITPEGKWITLYTKKDYLIRGYSGYLSYEDVIKKYAPNYKELYDEGVRMLGMPNRFQPNHPKIWSHQTLTNIARGLARIDIYNKGFTPSHMLTRKAPFMCPELYFASGYHAQGSVTKCQYYLNSFKDPKWGSDYKGIDKP